MRRNSKKNSEVFELRRLRTAMGRRGSNEQEGVLRVGGLEEEEEMREDKVQDELQAILVVLR